MLVDVYGEGILITGESGIGKSEAALELIKRGHRLVSDDVVELRKVSDVTLVGSAVYLETVRIKIGFQPRWLKSDLLMIHFTAKPLATISSVTKCLLLARCYKKYCKNDFAIRAASANPHKNEFFQKDATFLLRFSNIKSRGPFVSRFSGSL